MDVEGRPLCRPCLVGIRGGQPNSDGTAPVPPAVAKCMTPSSRRPRHQLCHLLAWRQYKLVASSQTPMALLEGVAAGLTMEFIVHAVDGGAQSVPSDPITVTTPMEAKPSAAAVEETTAPETEVAPLAAIVPNGNGSATNGNGSSYGNGSRVPAGVS
jgi:hypothetical protein